MVVLLGKSLMTSLSKLNANDTKRVTDFIDKFYDNPAHPSISLERVTKAKMTIFGLPASALVPLSEET